MGPSRTRLCMATGGEHQPGSHRRNVCIRPLARAIAFAMVVVASSASLAAPPSDDAEPLPELSGTTLLTSPGEGVGCQGIQTNPRVISLCDGATHALPNATLPGTTWDVVRVGYGTTATFTGYNIVAELPTAGAGFFSPITIFSGPDGAYATATGTFTNTTVYMAPQALANVIATTGGVLNLGSGTVIGLNPANTYSPTMTLAALTAFGGGVVNADGTVVNLPSTLATAFQITNTGPGGGLPSQGTLGQINASNMTVTLGSGNGTTRTRGALVAGEAELNLTDSSITAGNYSLGIYNYFGGAYTSAVSGSRSNVLRSTIALGNDSVGWWGNGALAPARLTATDSEITVGTGSWGLYMVAGTAVRLTNTNVTAGADSYGALMHAGANLTIDGTSAMSAIGAGSIGISNDASSVIFGAGTPSVAGGDLGLEGIAAGNFTLQSGSALRVSASEGGGTGVQLDASTFSGVAGSTLTVAMNGSTGTGISVSNGASLSQAGTVGISGPGTAVSVSGAGSSVSLAGGGTASTAAGTGSVNAPTVLVADAATFNASNLSIGSSGAQAARGLLALDGAQATLRGGSVTTVGINSSAVGAVQGAILNLEPGVAISTTGAFSAGLDAVGGTINASGTTVTATGAPAPALLLGGTGASVQFAGGGLSNASGGTILVTGTGAVADLSDTQVGGSGEWLTVTPASTASADGTLTITRSTLTGSAQTAPGSVSNVTLIDSTWFLTGSSVLTSLVNDPSLIDFASPTGDPALLASYKTLTVNSYAGDGTLAMNTFLGADQSPSDRLVIDAGTGTGPGQVAIKRTAGDGDLTVANGILIVDAINGATTTADAFRLGARVVGGPYEYTLQRGSRDATAPESWYLRSTIDCNATNAPSPPCPPPPDPPSPPPPPPNPPTPPPEPPDPAPPVPHYRAEVSLYASLAPTALQYGRSLIDTLHERVGEQELLRGHDDLEGTRSIDGAWGRLMYVNGKSDDDRAGIYGAGPSYDYVFGAIQSGWDVYRREDPDETRVHAGLYGAIGYAETQVDHFDGTRAGDDRVDGYTLGGYWTRYSAREAYVDAVLQATWYEASATSALALGRMETEGWGFAGSVEGGYPFAAGGDWIIEPQAQLIYSWLDLDDTSDLGAVVQFDDTESLVGRLSGKFARAWAHDERLEQKLQTTAWLRLSAWYEFTGDPVTGFSSQAGIIPFHADMGGGWGEVELGATREIDKNFFFYGNVGYSRGFDDDRSAWEGKIGLRGNW